MASSSSPRPYTSGLPEMLVSVCVECGEPLDDEYATVVLGFGQFHPECVETCPDGWLWPASLISSGEVNYYCGGCALASGRHYPDRGVA